MCADFIDLKEGYLQWLQFNKGRSTDTARKYGGYLDRLNIYLVDHDLSVKNISLNNLEDFTGTEVHNSGLSTNSRRPMVSAITGFFTWLLKEEIINENPTEHLARPKKVHR